MEQRPTRFYITQEEDQTVVRSVPMARPAKDSLSPGEPGSSQVPATPIDDSKPSVATRIKAAVKRN